MELVRSALGYHHHVAAVDVTELGIRIRRDHPDLVERIGARVIPNGIVQVLVDLLPVEHVIVRLLPIAVHVRFVIRASAALGRVLPAIRTEVGRDRTRSENRKLREITPVDWKAVDRVRRERLAKRRRFRLKNRLPVAAHVDRRVIPANRKRNVDLRRLVDVQLEWTIIRHPKAGSCHGYLVLTDLEKAYGVQPGLIRRSDRVHPGRRIGNRHGGAHNDRTRGIGDRSTDRSGDRLPQRRDRTGQ